LSHPTLRARIRAPSEPRKVSLAHEREVPLHLSPRGLERSGGFSGPARLQVHEEDPVAAEGEAERDLSPDPSRPQDGDRHAGSRP
jgi:hypothetical protein